MAKVGVEVDSSGVDAALREIRERTEDARPAFEAVGRLLVNRIRLCFRASRSPWGVPWLPIKFRAPAIAQAKGKYGGSFNRRDKAGKLVLTASGRAQSEFNVSAAAGKGSAGKPLVDTGLLRNSVTYAAGANSVEIGTTARQARLQHFGGRVVPRRAKALAFPGPGGELIVSRGVTIPARPFMPVSPQGTVMLPADWSRGALREIAKHFGAVS